MISNSDGFVFIYYTACFYFHTACANKTKCNYYYGKMDDEYFQIPDITEEKIDV